MKKLSKAQLEVLKELAKNDEFGKPVVLHFMEGLNAYWFISSTFKGMPLKVINYTTVKALEKAGVIERVDSEKFNKTRARITEKGREFLLLEGGKDEFNEETGVRQKAYAKGSSE